MYAHNRACAWSSITPVSLTFNLVIVNKSCFLRILLWQKGRLKVRGQKLAVGCHHTAYEWDHHHFCVSCREKNKGDDVCVTSKEEDCFVCLQFTAEQRKKLKAKKAYEKKKISKEAISKKVEDSLLGVDDIQPSQASANKEKSSNVPSTSNSSSSSNDPL